MQHVANISIAVMYGMYFLAALFGYLTFYGEAWSSSHCRTLCISMYLSLPLSHSACLSKCISIYKYVSFYLYMLLNFRFPFMLIVLIYCYMVVSTSLNHHVSAERPS